jgi:hypothetical protein
MLTDPPFYLLFFFVWSQEDGLALDPYLHLFDETVQIEVGVRLTAEGSEAKRQVF